MPPDPDADAPRRLRRAEAVLARRLGSLAVVVEDLHDAHNIDAVVRTAEAFGIQRIYRIESDPGEVVHPKVTQGAHKWLTLSVTGSTDSQAPFVQKATEMLESLTEKLTPLQLEEARELAGEWELEHVKILDNGTYDPGPRINSPILLEKVNPSYTEERATGGLERPMSVLGALTLSFPLRVEALLFPGESPGNVVGLELVAR